MKEYKQLLEKAGVPLEFWPAIRKVLLIGQMEALDLANRYTPDHALSVLKTSHYMDEHNIGEKNAV